MKSCWIVTKDHKNHLEYRDVPQPQPKAGEIVIKVMASALNRGEMFVGGVVHGGPEKLGGNEASGVVHAIGEGVTGVKVGDAVFGRVRGGFAEYAVMDATQLMMKRNGMMSEYQSGCILPGMMRKSEPSDDWWSVESSTPRTTSGIVIALMIFRGRRILKRSKMTGLNSSASTVV